MKAQKGNNASYAGALLVQLQSKKDAVRNILEGYRHLHSSMLGERDACARLTRKALESGSVPLYPWEAPDKAKRFHLDSSAERYNLIARLVGDANLKGRRVLRERLEIVLEELLTNSLYHAYRDSSGRDKYSRKDAVRLKAPHETLEVRFLQSDEGIYLSVTDKGGSLCFNSISRALSRCYSDTEDQIESKESGAGLGLYMVFEAATHIKVEREPGSRTVFSCWLSDKKTYDPDTFSFNYFGGESRDPK